MSKNVNVTKKLLFAVLTATLAVAACTKSDNGGEAAKSAAVEPKSTWDISSVGETMQFDPTDIYVKAGDDITINFKNVSTTLQHNWVLVKPGKEEDVGIAGIKAGPSKGFIPDDAALADSIIAHTKLVDANGTDTVKFKAPAAGDYPYICTNAGHHTTMKGVLHSK